MFEYLLKTEQKQQQTISPQQYQSLKILQMNTMQLEEYLSDLVLENPVLELPDDHGRSGLQSLDSIAQPLTWTWEEGAGWQEDDHPHQDIKAPDTGQSLGDYLRDQFYPGLDREETYLLDQIIDHLDSAGYLTATDEEIHQQSGYPQELVGYGVAYLQTLEPLGVCARTLQECLLIQLERQGYRDPIYRQLAGEQLENIAAGRYNKIARELGRSPKEIQECSAVIRGLQPKPGASFGGQATVYRAPDILVTEEHGELAVHMTHQSSPVRVNNYYARMAKQDEYGEAAAYLEAKLNQAKWVITAVQGRMQTLRAIAEILARHQREFFLEPKGQLRPLSLADAATELELHESTISRAISGKYLQCGRGTFPLKYFFAVRAGNSSQGEPASRDAVKNRILALIAEEDKQSPLSDNTLVELLERDGLRLSRRVIAKYRSELGIPATSARKER